jgi:glycosyltransferase involved in cell wall biosynthesis
MTLVSVIIPAYNAARFVGDAIESVLRQTISDFEVIVIDDGSTDNTAVAVATYLSDPRVRCISQKNGGLPGARNAGAENSRGEYLAFLDADDCLAPNALELVIQKFEESGAAWLNVGVLKIDGDKRSFRHPITPQGDLLLAILEDDFITRSPFYPRKEFFAIGKYDEEIRMREDWDINIRMIAAGKPFALVDEALYLYARTEGSITTGNRRKLYSYTERLMRKHHKRLADAAPQKFGHIYAANMWDLARRYLYEIRDFREALRCMKESLRYDMNLFRLLHPVIHHIQGALGRHKKEPLSFGR